MMMQVGVVKTARGARSPNVGDGLAVENRLHLRWVRNRLQTGELGKCPIGPILADKIGVGASLKHAPRPFACKLENFDSVLVDPDVSAVNSEIRVEIVQEVCMV